MTDTAAVQTIECPTCHRKLQFVDYILRGGVRVESAAKLGKEQTVWEAVEYHCPYCNVELPKRLLLPNEKNSHTPIKYASTFELQRKRAEHSKHLREIQAKAARPKYV